MFALKHKLQYFNSYQQMMSKVISYDEERGVLHRSTKGSWILSPTRQAVPPDEHHPLCTGSSGTFRGTKTILTFPFFCVLLASMENI